MKYNIVKTAEGGVTTYRVAGMEQTDNQAICQALTEAAKDVWQYLTTRPGAYTAAEMRKTGLRLRDGLELPIELRTLRVECGEFNLCVKPINNYGGPNYSTIFNVLAEFEKLARVKQNDRAVFTVGEELGELVCEARVVLPNDMKAICACCGQNPLRPAVSYPALDLDRRCIVATDERLMVAKKVTLAYIHYEDKVPETFYLPKEVERMRGEVTVKLYERGCTVIDQNDTEVSVEHVTRYPSWHTVWPKYHGGMTLVDSKAMTKMVKCAANGLPKRGKGSGELLLLNHYSVSRNLVIRGYQGAKMVNEQRVVDCIAPDEVSYRLMVRYERLLKVLALQPKTMWVGYSEYGTLPDRLVMEDGGAEMAVQLYHCVDDDLEDSLRETEAGYVITDTRRLYHGYSADGWLLEQIETKHPSSGEKPEPPKPTKKAKVPTKAAPKKVTQIAQKVQKAVTPEPTIADRLREALRARMAA